MNEGWQEVPGNSEALGRRQETEADCVNVVSLMLTETSHSVTVSYDESTRASACCLLGVASHTGPLSSSSGGQGTGQNPEILAATWLIYQIQGGWGRRAVERRPEGRD